MKPQLKVCAVLLILHLSSKSAKCADPPSVTADATITQRKTALIKSIEQEFPASVRRRQDGNVYCLDLPFEYATDENLAVISQCSSLRKLTLRLSSQNDRLTSHGLTHLNQLPQLETIALMCPRALRAGFFEAVTKLPSVRSLTLNRAEPGPAEYPCLTNMLQLQELTITEAPHFGDKEALNLLKLPNLKRLTLADTSVSDAWLAVARSSKSLTNVTVRLWDKDETVVWSRRLPE